jgi:hypothetical protein
MTVYFKVLTATAQGPSTGIQWLLPGEGRMPAVVGDLVEGEMGIQGNGYYICKLWQLPWWDRVGHRVFIVEPSEETIDFYKHSVSRRAELTLEVTWDDRRRRLFCANIADELMADYEVTYNDGAVELAVEAARLFANGEITTAELATARTAAETAALAAWRGERVSHPESEAWLAGLARAAAFACWNPSNPPSQFMVGATVFASGFRPYSRETWERFKDFSWCDADIESAWQIQELAFWMSR